MRILPVNDVILSTITATNEDINYPAINIAHYFIKKIFKATQNTSVVTFTFATAKSIDCCYISFTNATSATLVLYDSSDAILATKTIDISTSGGIFTKVENVKYAKLTLTASSLVYLGTLALGETYKMPNPDNNIIKVHVDNSVSTQSSDGQYTINKIDWLKSVALSFTLIGIDLYNILYALFSDIDRPIWIDIYEELNNGINPFYSVTEFSEDAQKMHTYSFKLKCTEAR